MTNCANGHTTVLAGHGFAESGPYLLINDVEQGEQHRFPVLGKTFSLRRLPTRRCVGRFDLASYTKEVCPLNVELLPDAKDTMCPACQEATGFNPSFYYADFISAQQRAYNLTPHFTYLAYFSPKHVKAGISSETRGIERLLEQGARAARIVGRFGCADDARELEAALCAQPGILETMRASKKVDLLVNERFDFVEAKAVLDDVVERLGLEGAEPAQDLSPHYFGGPSPDCHDLQVPEGHDGECGGRCIGMVGGALVFQQEGTNYVVSVKEWESHEVELLLELHEGRVAGCALHTDAMDARLAASLDFLAFSTGRLHCGFGIAAFQERHGWSVRSAAKTGFWRQGERTLPAEILRPGVFQTSPCSRAFGGAEAAKLLPRTRFCSR